MISYAAIDINLNSTYIHFMDSINILKIILFGVLIAGCSNNPTDGTSNSKPNHPEEEYVDNRRLIYVTVLDLYNDTIGYETPFEMASSFSSNEFQIGGHYTINYKTYHKLSKHFINQDPAQKRIQHGIELKFEYATLKKEFEKPKYHQFKTTYLKEIDWLSIDATQIGPDFYIWDNASNEEIATCKKAIKSNDSYAEMLAKMQLKQPNSLTFELYMKKAQDIVFIKDFSIFGLHYMLNYEESEYDPFHFYEAFHFHDLEIIADLNNDSIGDRAAAWYKNDSYGYCGITKKTPNGLIEFFEVNSLQ